MILKPYTKTKPSGVEWLGEVPEHWEVKRNRFSMRVNPSSPKLRSLEPDDEVSFIPMDAVGVGGGLRLDDSRSLADVSSGYTEFQDNDVVIAKITPCFENGKAALAQNLLNGAAYGTTELHVLRAGDALDPLFLFYLAISDTFQKLGESEMYGAGGQKRVPPEFCKDFRAALPPPAEQTAIAAYLDRETGRIDELVGKKRELIERLKEKSTALISRTVIRGLPADLPPSTLAKLEQLAGEKLPLNPPLKPTGIEWLGDVPEHWEVKRLRFIARIQTGNTPSKSDDDNYADDGVLWVKPDDLKDFEPVTSTKEYLSSSGLKLSRPVPAWSALVCCIGTVGKFGYAKQEVATNQQINSVIFETSKVARLYGLYLIAATESEHINRANKNVVPILNTTQQSNISVTVPPLPEQIAIAAYLDEETAKLDALVAKVETAIERLQEYRTALITAAVTGKIDVRS